MNITLLGFSKALWPALIGMAFISGCAHMYHAQVGQIDNRDTYAQIPFQVMVSETGVSSEEIGLIAKATNTRGGDNVASIAAIVALFQMGDRTGNPVYNENYAKNLIYEIHKACPSGRVTSLLSIREHRKYPTISGEIVKVTGICLKTRKKPVDVGSLKNISTEGKI